MKKSTDRSIRRNAILVYLVVALVLLGVVWYMNSLSKTIARQRASIEGQSHTLALTNSLIDQVQQAQVAANLFAISGNRSSLDEFKAATKRVNCKVDTLQRLMGLTVQGKTLQEIGNLLNRKERVVLYLSRQIGNTNPIYQIEERLSQIPKPTVKNSYRITTTRKDTIISSAAKKGFWKRLGNVFAPADPDTSINISTVRVDTLRHSAVDSLPMLNEVRQLSEEANRSYADRIKQIERNVAYLISTDQQLSVQLSGLLMLLNRQSLDSTFEEIEKSEQLFRKSNRLLMASSAVALLLILLFVYLIINDVNRGVAARKALEQAKKHTEELMESRHQLLLSVSHDIKSPLSSIIGYLDLWRTEPMSASSRHRIESMQSSGNHILALLANLLEFSSLEKGNRQVVRGTFDLLELCRDVVNMFQPLAEQKQLVLELAAENTDRWDVISDKTKIKQLLINLISNAIKYTSEGGVAMEVAATSGGACFTITDTGIGIPSERVSDLFKPFNRLDGSSAVADGNGFGMYVVRGLLDMLGGKIEVESEIGMGTTVRILLPLEAASPAVPSSRTEASWPAATHAYHVLLVDDDATLLEMTQEMLRRLGHSVVAYANPSEIISNQLDLSLFDYLVTDMEMGSCTGVDVLNAIRDQGITIPAIVMTARPDFNLTKATEIGFSGYLQKPFTQHQLASAFDQHAIAADSTGGGVQALYTMFDGDIESVRHVLAVFVDTSTKNMEQLRDAVNSNDFVKAQALCHKMVPMFLQLDTRGIADTLAYMDSLRGQDANVYPQWRGKLCDFMLAANQLIEKLEREHLS